MEVDLAYPVITDMAYAEDCSFMTFRIVLSDGTSPCIKATPFEMATLLTRLGELHRQVQVELLAGGLGAPSAGLVVEEYDVQPNLDGNGVSLQLRPRGSLSLHYQLTVEMARKIAHELLAAADQKSIPTRQQTKQ